MDFLKQPVARDTTLGSSSEILGRLATLLHGLGIIGGLVLVLIGLARGSVATGATGGVFLLVGVGLHLTRGRWKPGGAAPVVPVKKAAPGALSAARAADVSAEPRQAGAAGRRPRVLLLNASLAGASGNSARLLAKLRGELAARADVEEAALAGEGAADFAALAPALRAADGLVIATGTHWDSWSSSLQKFLEDATPSEATALWMGKPAAVVVSEHSTGGKGVLSRLQGVLATFGCVIPPMSGVVISRSGWIARRHAPAESDDFWCAEDLAVVAHNLAEAAARPRVGWRAWPVDRENFSATWVE